MRMTVEDLQKFIKEREYYIIEIVFIGGKLYLIDNKSFVHSYNGCFPVDVPFNMLPFHYSKLGEP